MTIGERIRTLRLQMNMSQGELGAKVGLQKAAINKYETGVVVNLKPEKVVALASALNTTPAYIMGWEDTGDSFGDVLREYLPEGTSDEEIQKTEANFVNLFLRTVNIIQKYSSSALSDDAVNSIIEMALMRDEAIRKYPIKGVSEDEAQDIANRDLDASIMIEVLSREVAPESASEDVVKRNLHRMAGNWLIATRAIKMCFTVDVPDAEVDRITENVMRIIIREAQKYMS